MAVHEHETTDAGARADDSASRGLGGAPSEPDPLARDVVFRRVQQHLLGTAPDPIRIGRYVVLRHLGVGGMGVVFAAYDEELERKVAIKVLRRAEATEVEATRMRQEAQALARVSHPNVVTVHEVGADDERVYIAMEFVAGSTLGAWLREQTRAPAQILDVLRQAGQGLAALHGAGLVHRDVKPENVMVAPDGRVRVMDLGLARWAAATAEEGGEASGPAADAGPDTRLTQTGALLGTPAYMSPEQVLGEDLDARTDQFSFCVMLQEALFGRRPFEGSTLETLVVRITQEDPTPPPAEAPAAVRRVLARGLARRPEDRFVSMQALLDALEPRRSSTRRWMGGAAVVGLLGLGTWAAVVQTDPCAGVGARWDGVWDEGRAAAIGETFAATGTPHAEQTWQRARDDLDAWVDDWTRRKAATCRAVPSTTGPDPDVVLQDRCLREAAVATQTLVDALASADRKLVLRTPTVLAGLRDLSDCDDLVALRAPAPLPSDPEARQRLESLSDDLAAASALELAGADAESRDAVARVVAEARTIGYAPLLGRALHLQSKVGFHADREASLAAAREAYFEAVAGSDDETAATVATVLAGQSAGAEGEALTQRLTWLDHADASIRRLGEPAKARARWHSSRGLVALDAGDYAAAVEHLQAAVEGIEAEHGADARGLVTPLNNLGLALGHLDRDDAALATFERALAIQRAFSGEHHPDTALLAFNLASVQQGLAHYDEARAAFTSAMETFETFYGDRHPYIAVAKENLGSNARYRGELDEAIALYEDAIGRMAATKSMAVELGRVHRRLGETLAEAGRVEEAEPHLHSALTLHLEALGEDHPGVAVDRAALATFLVDRGRGEEARPLLALAHTVAAKAHGPEHELTKEIETVQARLGPPPS